MSISCLFWSMAFNADSTDETEVASNHADWVSVENDLNYALYLGLLLEPETQGLMWQKGICKSLNSAAVGL